MPKIYVSNQDPITVSQEEADRILDQKVDPEFKGMIEINGQHFNKQQIRKIDSRETDLKAYNLDDESDRQIVRNFETALENFRRQAPPGWLFERYCESRGAIRLEWFRGEPTVVVKDPNLYTELRQKNEALRLLEDRREHARRAEMIPEDLAEDEKKKEEARKKVRGQLGGVLKKVEMPKSEDPVASALGLENPPEKKINVEDELPPLT